MKLLFDYQIFLAQPHGGISRYFCNLIKHLKNDAKLEVSLPIHNHDNEYLNQENKIVDLRNNKKSIFDLLKKTPDQNLEVTKNILQKGDFDILHATYYDSYFLNSLNKKPFVITVHDMIYEIFPELFPLKDKTAIIKKELAIKADKVIVVSQHTKKDLLKFTNIKEEKISVIYQACSFDKNQIALHQSTKSNKNDYLLFVGNRGAYKNFYFMLCAITDVLKNNSNLDLICFGAPFSKKEKCFIENLGLDKKVKQLCGNDDILIGLYKNALAFITPSYYEGFGVTVLEAFACGCPVISSNVSAIPEAVENAAIYFDPKDPSSIKNAVEQVIASASLRSDLIVKGHKQNDQFSWPQIATQMKQAYQSIL